MALCPVSVWRRGQAAKHSPLCPLGCEEERAFLHLLVITKFVTKFLRIPQRVENKGEGKNNNKPFAQSAFGTGDRRPSRVLSGRSAVRRIGPYT